MQSSGDFQINFDGAGYNNSKAPPAAPPSYNVDGELYNNTDLIWKSFRGTGPTGFKENLFFSHSWLAVFGSTGNTPLRITVSFTKKLFI